MFGSFINLAVYSAGFLALICLNVHGLVSLGIDEDWQVTALLIASPLLIWAQAAVYHYMYEGIEIACTRATDYSADLARAGGDHAASWPVFAPGESLASSLKPTRRSTM